MIEASIIKVWEWKTDFYNDLDLFVKVIPVQMYSLASEQGLAVQVPSLLSSKHPFVTEKKYLSALS